MKHKKLEMILWSHIIIIFGDKNTVEKNVKSTICESRDKVHTKQQLKETITLISKYCLTSIKKT